MGSGHVINSIGLLFLGPPPALHITKDSVNAWSSQIIGLLLINIGMGMGTVPSIPAMKESVDDDDDLFDDVISSIQVVITVIACLVILSLPFSLYHNKYSVSSMLSHVLLGVLLEDTSTSISVLKGLSLVSPSF